MSDSEGTNRLWWAVPAATIVLLLTAVLLLGQPESQNLQHGTSYDASWRGSRAAYLLLDGLGYAVTRSKTPTGGAARLVLFPSPDQEKAGLLDDWVREGGIVALADGSPEFASHLGIDLKVSELKTEFEEEPASAGGIARLAGGRLRVDWEGGNGRVWIATGDDPFVTVYGHGRGQIWLLNRPEFLTNKLLKQADNAVLLCRLADAMMEGRAGTLSFDEYVHGMRDRPGVAQLLVRPPALWVTLQCLLLAAVLLWHLAPRFGQIGVLPSARRRSKEEFLDAMASLLERKGDYAEACRTAQDELTRDIERELGLPANTPRDRLVEEAARRRSIDKDSLRRALGGDSSAHLDKAGFVDTLNQLEATRDEFFQRRSHR